jgi:RNA polymerase sigma-70 factor (ECF subfamily)
MASTRVAPARVRIEDGLAFNTVLAAAKAQAPWAVQKLYRSVKVPVHGYLRAQGIGDPEDLASEVFLRVFRSLARFEGDQAAFRSWVFTIAHHLIIDERRKTSRRPTLVELSDREHREAAGGDAEQEALAALSDTNARRMLQGLTEAQRSALLLRIVADMSVEQIAHALGKRPGTVKALQRRALASIRRQLTA